MCILFRGSLCHVEDNQRVGDQEYLLLKPLSVNSECTGRVVTYKELQVIFISRQVWYILFLYSHFVYYIVISILNDDSLWAIPNLLLYVRMIGMALDSKISIS